MREQPVTDSKPKKSNRSIALAITGTGLLILVVLALLFLEKPSAKGANEREKYVSVTPIEVDFPAPELNLTDLDGNAVSLADNLGRVVLLNNWAFWCPPCRAELPELQAFYKAHREQGFTVIGIEAGDEREDVLYHVKLYKLTYPVWLDPTGASLRAFQNGSLPNSYVIDRKGRVRLTWVGVMDRPALEQFVTPLLEEE